MQSELKLRVKEHWENETCGIRYSSAENRKLYFDEISTNRYNLEPYIRSFANFEKAKGLTVLEIGVGAGADFQNWCMHALHATGVDLTEAAIALTQERLRINNIPQHKYTLKISDAENLPFADNSFDLVYSWGVLHHSPDTYRAFQETLRVLKPGGQIKAMIYHVPSWTGILLYVQHALLRGKLNMSMKEVIFSHLESPGTKAYTVQEAKDFLIRSGFARIQIDTKLGPGDLLTIKPSDKYQSSVFKLIWQFYPRWLVRLIGDRYGLNLLIDATKPASR